MGTTADKLNKLVENKNAIKTAIINKKGATISDNMSTWANEISTIEPPFDTISITENGTYNVKDYKNAEVVVPSEDFYSLQVLYGDITSTTLENFSVAYGITKIKDNCFSSLYIKNLTIPNTIKFIGINVFNGGSTYGPVININYNGTLEQWALIEKIGSNNLDSAYQSITTKSEYTINLNNLKNEDIVYLSSNLTSLPFGSLSGLWLKNIVIPKTITSIGRRCFSGAFINKKIEFEEGCYITTLPKKCFAYLNAQHSTGIVDIILPKCDNIETNIFDSAKINKVIFKEGLTQLNSYCFNSTYINSIVLPQTLEKINGYSFRNVNKLKELIIPKTVTLIENNAFYMSTNYTLIMESETPCTLGGYYAIDSKVEKIYVPKGTSSVYKSATNWSSFASKIFEKNIIVVNIPSELLNNENITYSLDSGKTYQQFTLNTLTLNEVATIKIKSIDSTQTILIGTTSGGNDLGTISNSEITLSFTTDTIIYLTIQ